jgi:type II secretory pathway component PulJ
MYRTFNFAGDNGPIGFIMQGKKRKPGYTDQFLVKSGCAKGSTIVMTENAFMTDKAWEEMADNIVTGYRSLPIVRDNPSWWMIEIFDGFGAHLNNLPALKKRVINKILSLKEEGDSSSINQAYDKNMAREDKRIQRQALGILRQETIYCKNLFDQWKLLLCGLAAVRHSARHPEIGINSAIAVNLHPKFQMPFKDWCKKIEPSMQAADSFDLVAREDSCLDVYTLLPAKWQVMAPTDKQTAVDIVKRHGQNAWDINCIHELVTTLKVPMSELVALQTCIFLAIENPSHINRGLVEDEDEDSSSAHAVAPVINQEVAEAEANRKNALSGLSLFQRKPEGMTGMDAFYHQVNFRQRAYANKPDEHKINPALMVSPRNHHQRALMDIEYTKKVQGTLMRDISEGVPREQAARVRLDNVAQIKHHSQFINDPARIERLEMRLKLNESLGMAETIHQRNDDAKLEHEKFMLSGQLPSAITIFKDGETGLRKFQIKHAKALLITVFGYKPKKKTLSRKELIEALEEEAAKNPNRIEEYERESQEPSLLTAVEGAAAGGIEEELASTSETAPGLYQACVAAVKTMESSLTPLELALVCREVVREIESSDSYERELDSFTGNDYHVKFFMAFDKSVAKKRDSNFVFQLSDMVHEMIEDENLTEDALRKEMKKHADSEA